MTISPPLTLLRRPRNFFTSGCSVIWAAMPRLAARALPNSSAFLANVLRSSAQAPPSGSITVSTVSISLRLAASLIVSRRAATAQPSQLPIDTSSATMSQLTARCMVTLLAMIRQLSAEPISTLPPLASMVERDADFSITTLPRGLRTEPPASACCSRTAPPSELTSPNTSAMKFMLWPLTCRLSCTSPCSSKSAPVSARSPVVRKLMPWRLTIFSVTEIKLDSGSMLTKPVMAATMNSPAPVRSTRVPGPAMLSMSKSFGSSGSNTSPLTLKPGWPSWRGAFFSSFLPALTWGK